MTFSKPAGKLGMNRSVDMEFETNFFEELLHELHRKEILEEINSLCNAEAV